jgi:hypothetical protein
MYRKKKGTVVHGEPPFLKWKWVWFSESVLDHCTCVHKNHPLLISRSAPVVALAQLHRQINVSKGGELQVSGNRLSENSLRFRSSGVQLACSVIIPFENRNLAADLIVMVSLASSFWITYFTLGCSVPWARGTRLLYSISCDTITFVSSTC